VTSRHGHQPLREVTDVWTPLWPGLPQGRCSGCPRCRSYLLRGLGRSKGRSPHPPCSGDPQFDEAPKRSPPCTVPGRQV